MNTRITRKYLRNILLKLPRHLVAEFGLFCARDVEHLVRDVRVKACNDCLEGYLLGQRNLTALKAAAYDASDAAYAVKEANDAVSAAYAAYAAAHIAAYNANDANDAVNDAVSAAAYAATASNKDLDFYHNHLLKMIKDLTEVEKLIWGIL